MEVPVTLDSVEPKAGDHLEIKMFTERGFNQEEFDKLHGRRVPKTEDWKSNLKKVFPSNARAFITDRFPVLKMASSYRCKDFIINDFFSGLSVALMAIPQSFGYARIANIPEIIGLYTSFFPVVIYFIFTTSSHVSLGTMALASLVIGSAVNSMQMPSESFKALSSNESLHVMNVVGNLSSDALEDLLREKDDETKILLTVSLSCGAGLILLIMSFFKMGFIVSFMSEAFVSGFLAASTIRVLIIELKDILGVHPEKKHVGFCEFFTNTYEIFREMGSSNIIQVGMSSLTLVVLLIVKEYVNKRYKDKLKIPIPIEIIVVVVSVIATKFAGLESTFGIEISTGIRSGLPSIVVPSFGMMYHNVLTSFLLAIIGFMMVGMMAKLFAQNHGYRVDDNQEMFAVGISGVLGSFFCSMLPSTSPPRCFLAESSGSKTQLTHLFSALFSLLAMVAFAPLLRDLPVCVLACIIVVACVPLFPHITRFVYFWRASRYDFCVWFVTFATVLAFSVEAGMLVGISFHLVAAHVWMKMDSRSALLEKTDDGLFLDGELYSIKPEEFGEKIGLEGPVVIRDSVLIFRFESPLYFATLENFKEAFFAKVPSYVFLAKPESKKGEDCSAFSCLGKKELTQVFHAEGHEEVKESPVSICVVLTPEVERIEDREVERLTVPVCDEDKSKREHMNDKKILNKIIVDCSNMAFCDSSGGELLASMNSKYRDVGVDFCLADCSENVKKQLSKLSACKDLVRNCLYPTVRDAYLVGRVDSFQTSI